uniref:Uncharacterized protein n=1 Tax=Aegilops tauschii subsp. strangulata TaxID=200361 RepID=A0A453PW10_AEGTS
MRCGGRSPRNDRSLACYLLLFFSGVRAICSLYIQPSLLSSVRPSASLAPAVASRPLFLVLPHSTRRCTASVDHHEGGCWLSVSESSSPSSIAHLVRQ